MELVVYPDRLKRQEIDKMHFLDCKYVAFLISHFYNGWSVCVCVCVDYLVLSVGQPAATQSYWIEAGAGTGVAA